MLDGEPTPSRSESPESTPENLWCRAMTKAGTQCHGWPDKSGFCPSHRPGAAENRAAGGRASAKVQRLEKKLPSRLRPVVELLSKALVECHQGKLPPSQASAMAAVAGAIIKVLEHGEFEMRLARLEEILDSKKGDQWQNWQPGSRN